MRFVFDFFKQNFKTDGRKAHPFFLFLLLTSLGVFAEAKVEIEIQDTKIKMRDGVELAITYYLPPEKKSSAACPVLFELLPYRKDDSFLARDYSLYSYFVKQGFIVAKVDVRGTGGSGGVLPEGEYTETEIDDAVEIIDKLSRLPRSNGKVGMFGISWSGFNAILTAVRNPPALKAILAADSSDDLFHDDVHFIDGAFHMDEYEFTIDHEKKPDRKGSSCQEKVVRWTIKIGRHRPKSRR